MINLTFLQLVLVTLGLTSLPAQIIGTAGSIVGMSGFGSASNVFTFGIINRSGSNQTVQWGYNRI